MTGPTIDMGVLVSHSPTADVERLDQFTRRLTATSTDELRRVTDAGWRFHVTERTRLSSDEARRPSDFLDEASLQMVEGPYDIVIVVTDVGLVSSRRSIVGGLASPVSRVAVLSTRKLLLSRRGQPGRSLEDESVHRNGVTLLLHLVGHLLGLDHIDERGSGPLCFRERPREGPVHSPSPNHSAAIDQPLSGTGGGRRGSAPFLVSRHECRPQSTSRPQISVEEQSSFLGAVTPQIGDCRRDSDPYSRLHGGDLGRRRQHDQRGGGDIWSSERTGGHLPISPPSRIYIFPARIFPARTSTGSPATWPCSTWWSS